MKITLLIALVTVIMNIRSSENAWEFILLFSVDEVNSFYKIELAA